MQVASARNIECERRTCHVIDEDPALSQLELVQFLAAPEPAPAHPLGYFALTTGREDAFILARVCGFANDRVQKSERVPPSHLHKRADFAILSKIHGTSPICAAETPSRPNFSMVLQAQIA